MGQSIEHIVTTIGDWSGALLAGAIMTLKLSVTAFIVGQVIGMVCAAARLWGGPVARRVALVYTTMLRAVPELLLILLLYYTGSAGIVALFQYLGFGNIEIDAFATTVIVLGIVQGAYAAEVFRGAILSIPEGQIEAANVFAFPPFMMMWRIIIPAMMPVAIPGMANLWVILVKDSSLVSVVGFSELLSGARAAAASTKMYFTFYCAAGLIYLVLTLVSNRLAQIVERRVRHGSQQPGG